MEGMSGGNYGDQVIKGPSGRNIRTISDKKQAGSLRIALAKLVLENANLTNEVRTLVTPDVRRIGPIRLVLSVSWRTRTTTDSRPAPRAAPIRAGHQPRPPICHSLAGGTAKEQKIFSNLSPC